MGTPLKRTDEQIFADSMDMQLHRQASRAYTKGQSDRHWRQVHHAIERVRTLVRERMSEEDRRNTAFMSDSDKKKPAKCPAARKGVVCWLCGGSYMCLEPWRKKRTVKQRIAARQATISNRR